VHDSKALPELVDNIARSDNVTTIGKLFADDCAYDGNDIFRYIVDNGILPCIKVRKRMLKLDGRKETSLDPLILTQKCVTKVERQRKLWTKMDCCRESIFFHKKNV
jgi:hypothetical protein